MDFNYQAQKVSKKCEQKIAGRFKKSGLSCEKLDVTKRGGIDYFVHKNNDSKNGFLVEVKSVNSGGYCRRESIEELDERLRAKPGKHFHLSTFDPDFQDGQYDYIEIEKHLKEDLRVNIAKAINQYTRLTISSGKYKRTPFLVAFCFDFFSGFPERINFGELISDKCVSGVLMLGRDAMRYKIFINPAAKNKFQPNKFFTKGEYFIKYLR